MKTFNKKGDFGETSLLYGVRTTKYDQRCEAYGTIDEAVSFLGLSRNFCQPEVNDILICLQRELFIIGAELATPTDRYSDLTAKGKVIKPEMVQSLEDLIDDYEAKIDIPREFIIPGHCISSATLDITRAIIRRAERRIIALKEAKLLINDEVLKYMNRLADLVFILARYEEKVTDGNNPSN